MTKVCASPVDASSNSSDSALCRSIMPLVDLGTGIRANQRSGSILDDGF